MPCRWMEIKDKHGKVIGTAHVNMGRRKTMRCADCGKPSEKLCDYPSQVFAGPTCDRPMCKEHSVHVEGRDEDYCIEHAKAKGLIA